MAPSSRSRLLKRAANCFQSRLGVLAGRSAIEAIMPDEHAPPTEAEELEVSRFTNHEGEKAAPSLTDHAASLRLRVGVVFRALRVRGLALACRFPYTPCGFARRKEGP